MAKQTPKKVDFARVRAAIQRATESGLSFDEAAAKAAVDEPEAYRRIVKAPDA